MTIDVGLVGWLLFGAVVLTLIIVRPRVTIHNSPSATATANAQSGNGGDSSHSGLLPLAIIGIVALIVIRALTSTTAAVPQAQPIQQPQPQPQVKPIEVPATANLPMGDRVAVIILVVVLVTVVLIGLGVFGLYLWDRHEWQKMQRQYTPPQPSMPHQPASYADIRISEDGRPEWAGVVENEVHDE